VRFPFSLSPPWFTCAIFSQMYRPSQTPHLLLLSAWITRPRPGLMQITVLVTELVPCDARSKRTFEVGVFQVRRSSSLRYTPKVLSQKQTRVKLNRVFFPRFRFQARSLGCGFARWWVETVRISLIHSCASLIR
jgi:hypothetical protein